MTPSRKSARPLRVVVTAPGIFQGKHGRVVRRAPGYDPPRYTIQLDNGEGKVLLLETEMERESRP